MAICVPWDVHRTSPNQRLCYHARRRRNQEAMAAARLAYRRIGSPELQGPITLHYLVRRARALDDDNVVGGAKPIRDALCCRRKNGHGLTEDDTHAFVRLGGVSHETSRRYKNREELWVLVSTET